MKLTHLTHAVVYYGQQIKIKNKVEDIWLHTHEHKYPLQHDDGKISSQGQQVTGYGDSEEELDPNNVWIFYPAGEEPSGRVPLKNGDTVRVYHPASGKFLLTHDVASPLTMTNQEVTLHDWSDEKRRNDMLWTVQITHNTAGAKGMLKSMSTQFKLVHVPTKVHLNNHQMNLPKWGFEQREINGCKRGHKESSKWTISHIIDAMTEEEEKERAARKKPNVSFFDKFFELQNLMIRSNAKLLDDHPFKSTPGTWPFVQRGIAFWDNKAKRARIYLLGNPIGWYVALFGIVGLLGSLLKEAFLWRRAMNLKKDEPIMFKYFKQGGFLWMAYAMHYFPFFTMSRSLYLHHYLPAFMISCMMTGLLFDHFLKTTKRQLTWNAIAVVGLILASVTVAAFVYFAPITFASDMPLEDLNKKKWVSTWDWP